MTPQFWGRLFLSRPDLDPPGYWETILGMGYSMPNLEEEDEPDEPEIEF